TLRQLALVRPSTLERMRLVSGVGDVKLRDFGKVFLEAIQQHCKTRGTTSDNPILAARPEVTRPPAPRSSPVRILAFEKFRQGAVVEDVMHQTGRARSTVIDFLTEFIRSERPPSLAPWVREDVYQRVVGAARQVGTGQLRPIFLLLGEKVSYDDI